MKPIKTLVLKRQQQVDLLDKARRLNDTYAQQIITRQLKDLDLEIDCWPMSVEHVQAALGEV